MRITIEPSAGGDQWEVAQHKVVIEHPSDEVGLNEALELLTGALRAYGYFLNELVEADDDGFASDKN